ncbi:hypothetical protein AAG906_030799 [Vitis piasezkii]
MKGEAIIVDVYNKEKKTSLFTGRHGVNMPRYPWTDGPEYITQCPIQPGSKFSQKIILSSEEGTIWWHAHTLATGANPNASDALLINGQPGDLFPCSKSRILHSIFTSSLPHLPAYNDTNASVRSWRPPKLSRSEHPCNGHTTPCISMDTVSMLLDGDLGILMKIRTLCSIIWCNVGIFSLQECDSRHVERHLTWGMETAFIVKNGKHLEAQMLPPPSDMPPC